MEPSSAYEAGQTFGRILVYSVLGVAALGGGIFFLIAVIKAFTKKTRGWIIGSIASGIVALVGVAGLIGAAATSLVKAAKTATDKKKTIASKDGRYRVEVPAAWREMPELHEEADIEAGNVLREQYLLVLENPKSDFEGTLAEFDDLVVGQMEGNLERAAISEPEPLTIDGRPALQRELTATVDKVRITYLMASIETDAAFYQVLTWTTPSRQAAALPVFREVIASFRADGGPTPAQAPAAGATTEQRVHAVIAGLLGTEASKLVPAARFVEDLGADSLDTVELVMAVEDEFNVAVPDEEAATLRTIGDLVAWLERQKQAGD
jgi:acyl carrier protein